MDIGMPTLIENKSAEESAKLCAELGLVFVELNMNLPMYQPDTMDIKNLLMLKQKYGIYFTIHLDENSDPAYFNSKVAEAYTETVLQTIEIAEKLSCPLLNMHMSRGVYFTLPDKKIYLYSQYIDSYLSRLEHFRNACEKHINNVLISLENTDGFMDFQKRGIELMLQSKCFSLTYDVGHNHCAANADRSFIDAHSDRLAHMHLHDAKGKACHLALGDGEIDIAEKLSLAKTHNCRIVLETKTAEGLSLSAKKLNEYKKAMH